MQRVCEPELMDDAEQAQAYAEADFSLTDAAMVERLVELFGSGPGGLGGQIVDLGCGPGNISFRLVARWPGASVLGIDGAPRMLAIAEARRAGLPEGERRRLSFACRVLPSDELDRPPLARSCSAIVSNSLLHHLQDPAVFWRTVRQLAAPGAAVYLQDLRRPAGRSELEDLVREQMAGAPEVLRRDFRHSLAAAFTPEEVAGQLRDQKLQGLQVAARGERHLEVWGRLD